MCFYMCVCACKTEAERKRDRRDVQKVQSSRRWLWANVSLSHPVFASPFARVYFSVTADISLLCLLCVSERDKKLDDLWAFSGSKQCAEASCLFLPSLLLALSCWSLHLILSASMSPRARLREAVLSDGWMDGCMVGGGRQETLVTHYSIGESHYMIRMAFFFLRVPDMPITQLNPLTDDEGPLVTFTSTRGEKNPAGNGDKQACCGCLSTLSCLNTCMHSLPFFKVMNNAIKLTLSA